MNRDTQNYADDSEHQSRLQLDFLPVVHLVRNSVCDDGYQMLMSVLLNKKFFVSLTHSLEKNSFFLGAK